MNPFLEAVLRIAQGHYGGAPPSHWVQSMQQQPYGQTPIGRRLLGNIGLMSPQQVMSIRPGNMQTMYHP